MNYAEWVELHPVAASIWPVVLAMLVFALALTLGLYFALKDDKSTEETSTQ